MQGRREPRVFHGGGEAFDASGQRLPLDAVSPKQLFEHRHARLLVGLPGIDRPNSAGEVGRPFVASRALSPKNRRF